MNAHLRESPEKFITPFNYNYLFSSTANENSVRRILLQELEYLKNIMVTVGIGPQV